MPIYDIIVTQKLRVEAENENAVYQTIKDHNHLFYTEIDGINGAYGQYKIKTIGKLKIIAIDEGQSKDQCTESKDSTFDIGGIDGLPDI